ncbi:MAG TPA: DUF1837 domain-containing protein [Puia sp.]|uniref:HamA C-terminal domain-containing protein n=1 Tax=Puia sp. TaxID=2045100 RepID=UPI002BB28A76|nr:DUF1837 domain-containing protein [Puia sp.]HVU93732.1 DUF1837 domain-containing protein [Puia sp.]
MKERRIPKLDFEIIIDESFLALNPTSALKPAENKNVLSLINDYEDGEWWIEKFQNFVWDNIAEAALSAEERQKLISKPHSQLKEAAKNLRLTDSDDKGSGSELAEIVLYGIMKLHYKALPVVPKIFYKQNSHDNAKGSDSVHIVLSGDDFTLWYGEAKFYNSIENTRLGEIVSSVEEALQKQKLKKENRIVSGVGDMDLLVPKKSVREEIKSLLKNGNSIDLVKPKLNIPILLLHECPITKANTSLSKKYRDDLIDYHKERSEAYFKKQISKLSSLSKYSDIKFHVILFPVASKENIVNAFLEKAALYIK